MLSLEHSHLGNASGLTLLSHMAVCPAESNANLQLPACYNADRCLKFLMWASSTAHSQILQQQGLPLHQLQAATQPVLLFQQESPGTPICNL